MKFIRNFKRLGKGDLILAGGKGASLGEMTRLGIVVPPDFIILSSIFKKFLDDSRNERLIFL